MDTVPVFTVDGRDPSRPLTEVAAARFTGNGLLLVADRSSAPSVTAFDGEGRQVWTWSGVGGGPHELRVLALAWPWPESMVTLYDPSIPKLVRLDETNGRAVGQQSLAWLSGVAGPGTTIVGPAGASTMFGRPNSSIGVIRDGISHTPLYAIDLEEERTELVFEVPRLEISAVEGARPPVFGLRAVVFAGRRVLAYGLGDGFRITEWAVDSLGSVGAARQYGRVYSRRRTTREMVEAQKEVDFARVRGPGAQDWRVEVNRRYLEGPIAEELPAYDRILVDALGFAWVRHFVAPSDSLAVWSIFSNDRRWLGEIAVPRSLDIVDVGVDRIAAVRLDPLEVPSVWVLPLARTDR